MSRTHRKTLQNRLNNRPISSTLTVFHSKHLFLSIEKAERLNARLILFFGGSEGIRPTSLSAVSVVKRNATLFRLPEAVDVQRIPSRKATNKKGMTVFVKPFIWLRNL